MMAYASAAFRMALAGLALWLGCAALLRAEDAVEAPAAAAPPEWPAVVALVVTEPASPLDLGTLLATTVCDIRLRVLNRSEKPVRITRLRSTCSCTVPQEPSPEPIPAGGSAAVSAQLFVAQLSDGAFRRFLFIDLAGAPQPFIAVELRGTRVPTVAVKPQRDLRLPPGLNPNEPWNQTFELTSNLKDQRLRLDKPVTSPRLKAEVTEIAPSRYELKVASVPALFRGRIAEEIKLAILEPAGYEPLVVYVRGQMGYALQIVPGLLQLRRPEDPAAPVTATVSVYGAPAKSSAPAAPRPGGSALTGRGAAPKPDPKGTPRSPRQAVDPQELKIHAPEGVSATPTVNEGRTVITFSFPPAVLEKMARGEIEIETTSGGTGSIAFIVGTGESGAEGAAAAPPQDEAPAPAAAAKVPTAPAPKP